MFNLAISRFLYRNVLASSRAVKTFLAAKVIACDAVGTRFASPVVEKMRGHARTLLFSNAILVCFLIIVTPSCAPMMSLMPVSVTRGTKCKIIQEYRHLKQRLQQNKEPTYKKFQALLLLLHDKH
jgi:hypothetical protein